MQKERMDYPDETDILWLYDSSDDECRRDAALKLRYEIQKEQQQLQQAQRMVDEQSYAILNRQRELDDLRGKWQQDVKEIEKVPISLIDIEAEIGKRNSFQ